MTIDAIGEPEATLWFAKMTRQCGPGGADRSTAILNAMMMMMMKLLSGTAEQQSGDIASAR